MLEITDQNELQRYIDPKHFLPKSIPRKFGISSFGNRTQLGSGLLFITKAAVVICYCRRLFVFILFR